MGKIKISWQTSKNYARRKTNYHKKPKYNTQQTKYRAEASKYRTKYIITKIQFFIRLSLSAKYHPIRRLNQI